MIVKASAAPGRTCVSVRMFMRCCVGLYLRHQVFFWPIILIKPLYEILIRCRIWSTIRQIKILSDYILWLDYYHGSKILVWNLLVWYHSAPFVHRLTDWEMERGGEILLPVSLSFSRTSIHRPRRRTSPHYGYLA